MKEDIINQISMVGQNEQQQFVDDTRDIGAKAENLIVTRDNENKIVTEHIEGTESVADWMYTLELAVKKGDGNHSVVENPSGGNLAYGNYSHAEGYRTKTSADASYGHSEGRGTVVTAYGGHAEGSETYANGTFSHAEGVETEARGEGSHAEGYQTNADGKASHAEGQGTNAITEGCHAEGTNTTAGLNNGHDLVFKNAHAEGESTTASGAGAHAEGYGTIASGIYSHAGGISTIAQGAFQTAIGKNNIGQGTGTQSASTDYAFIIGNGSNNDNRSNAFAIKWDGTMVLSNGTELSPDQFLPLLQLSSVKYETIGEQYAFIDPPGTQFGITFSPDIPEGITHRRILGFNIRETSMTNCKIIEVYVSSNDDITDLNVIIINTGNNASAAIKADMVYIEW